MSEEFKVGVGRRPTLMIATPMYGGMCTGPYVAGLLGTMNTMRQMGVSVYWAQIMNESLITRARNELARIFLDMEYDYLMFIDADICFDDQAVATLMAADKDVVCGIYPKKEIDWAKVTEAAMKGKDNLEDYSGAFVFNVDHTEAGYQETNEHGLVPVRHGGTGFMLIKREVFKRLMDKVPTYRTSTYKMSDGQHAKPLTHEFFATSIDHTGALLSEDYHFCELFRKHGGEIWANPFIKLQHVGTYIYGGNILKAGGNLK